MDSLIHEAATPDAMMEAEKKEIEILRLTSTLDFHSKNDSREHAHKMFDEMPTGEEDGSNRKGNNVRVMEQVTGSKCTAYVAINFSDVADAELLLEETKLAHVEQKLTVVGSSFGIPKVTLKGYISNVAEPLKEKVSGQQLEVVDSPPFDDDFDLPSESKNSSSISTFYYDFQVISSPRAFGFAIELLSSGEVCDLVTLNIGITIANKDNINPMNLDLEVVAYQIGEGYEDSMITD
ncbi:hypothetical protein K7X08_034396 [Anisodus acutangulus]|uniref:Uncharacterized protein n=1 Tax=Anisodus acutangulus TaxID=402998 RepID=A0A9Q1QZN6_9SOLA|nr:hypothetical protein K7X08_034396 [Anisodus acutangulus]